MERYWLSWTGKLIRDIHSGKVAVVQRVYPEGFDYRYINGPLTLGPLSIEESACFLAGAVAGLLTDSLVIPRLMCWRLLDDGETSEDVTCAYPVCKACSEKNVKIKELEAVVSAYRSRKATDKWTGTSASMARSPFGYCPFCYAPGVRREQHGCAMSTDVCANGDHYPSKDSLGAPPLKKVSFEELLGAFGYDVLKDALGDAFGYCPACHAQGTARNKRTGDYICANGHTYSSKEALVALPRKEALT